MLENKQYVNGQKVYELNGNILTYYFKSGKMKAQGRLEGDLMQGEWKFYRETGQLWQIGHFIDGKKDGNWMRYDKNDRIEYEETFKDGKIIKEKNR